MVHVTISKRQNWRKISLEQTQQKPGKPTPPSPFTRLPTNINSILGVMAQTACCLAIERGGNQQSGFKAGVGYQKASR